MKSILHKSIRFLGVLALFTFLFFLFSWYGVSERTNSRYGVTFATIMARELGLDPRETYDAIVDDLGEWLIRLPVYWEDIERERGIFDFSDYDYFFKRAEEKGVALIPVVGRKLPRWPECHAPEWAPLLSQDEFQKAVEAQIRVVVERYKTSSAVLRWQIENEPFHIYGSGCADKKITASNIDAEITLVRSLDSRPIMITDSGEQGAWFTALRRVEYLGISTYYQVWNDTLRVVRFPFGPGYYWLKGWLVQLFYPQGHIIISELQAEPWGPVLLPHFDLAFQFSLMNESRFREVIRRARLAGFEENILWGAEWWYWLKKVENKPGMWEEAKKVF